MIVRTICIGLLSLLARLSALAAPPVSAAEPVVSGVGLRVERIVTGSSERRSLWSLITGRSEAFELVRPFGVAWSGDDLIIADPGSARVARVDARGRWAASPRGALTLPIAVAVCPDGETLVSDSQSGKVWSLDRDLRPIRPLAQGLSRPTALACSKERLFVVETAKHRVLVLDRKGEPFDAFGARGSRPGEFNFPAAVAFADGALWVGDTLNFRLQRLSALDGAPLGEFGRLGDAPGETPRIKGIATDAAGRVWVTDAFLDNVAVFSPAGDLLIEAGWRGAAAGQFSFPAGIASHPDGKIAIADSLNRRVQIVRLVVSPSRISP